MKKALYILPPDCFEVIYGPAERDEIARMVEVYATLRTPESVAADPSILAEMEIMLTGWGAPVLDEAFLSNAPRLEAVFYGAVSIKHIVTDAFWERNILITSAYAANAEPVAEYTLSQILFCLKRGWHFAFATKRDGRYPERVSVPGAYGSTVGIISLGMIGRRVCELLKAFDLRVLAYDPFVSEDTARELGVELCSLDELFRRSDVVSLHAPWLKETEGMIQGRHFEMMKESASFINTARGAIVREAEMIEVLRRRPDLQAVLDVTHPEPPEHGSPLYTLPNVVLTPHIAGSMDGECRRMGRYMADELRRYVEGKPLWWAISRERAETLA